MALPIQYEVRRFVGGLDNSTSVFGHAAARGRGRSGSQASGMVTELPPGLVTERPRGPGQGRAYAPSGTGVHGRTDSFSTIANDTDGTGVWIEPSSGGTLKAYPRTVTTATLSTLTNITAAAYAKDSDGTERIVIYGKGAGTNDQLLWMTTAGAESTSLHTFASGSGRRASIAVYNDQFLVCNGVDNPISVDISTAAVADPINVARLTLTDGGGITVAAEGSASGNVKGVVKYYFATMTGTAESALSTALTVDASVNNDGAGDTVLISVPDHATYNSKTLRIYRSYADLTAPNYLAEVAVPASGGKTYVDNITDEELGDLPYLHGDPPLAAFTSWTVHRGRMFALAGNTLYWSDVGSHQSWFTATDGNSITIHKDDGDVGVALARTSEGLVIFKQNHIYIFLGDDEGSFRLSDALSAAQGPSVGTPHTGSVVAVPGGLIFYWRNGLYALSGGQVVQLSDPVESQWTDPSVIYPTDANVSVGYDPRHKHVYVGYDYDSGGPKSAFIFDLAGQWVGASSDAGALCYLYDPGAAARAPEFYGLSANGLTKVRQLVSDKLASPSNTTEKSRFTPSASYSGRNPHLLKRWLYLDFMFTSGTAADNVTVTPEIDGTALTAVTVPLPTTPGRKRVNIGQMGQRLTYEFKAALGQKPWGMYEVLAAYQELPGKSV